MGHERDGLTHVDAGGAARMVDVGDKPVTARRAVAEAVLHAGADVIAVLRSGATPKGAALETARVAGILAAKKTSELIPLCHSLGLDHVTVDFEVGDEHVRVVATAATRSATGVEMEALVAASVAGLTLYDMLKALSKTMVLGGVRLLEKTGGRSEYRAAAAGDPR